MKNRWWGVCVLSLMAAGCSHGTITPVPQGGIPEAAIGTWMLTSFACDQGTPTSALNAFNADLAAGKRLLWYFVDSSGNTRTKRVDPFEWSAGVCSRDSHETWGFQSPDQMTISQSEGTQTILGNSNPAHSAQVACPQAFAQAEARTFRFVPGATGFRLVTQGQKNINGWCQGGTLSWVFGPNPTPVAQWGTSPPNLNSPFIPSPKLEAELRTEIASFTDKWGLISPSVGAGTSGNGLLYSGEYVLLLNALGFLKNTDTQWFKQVVQSCEIAPGLLKRAPDNFDQEGPDDYVGVAAGSSVSDSSIANDILTYGQTHGVMIDPKFQGDPNLVNVSFNIPLPYVYNDPLPGTLQFPDGSLNLSAWLGRQPNLVAHFFYSAGKIPPPLLQAGWVAAVVQGATSSADNQDAWFLSWLLTTAARDRTPSAKDTAIAWRIRYEQLILGGRNQLFRTYFGNADHPLAHFWPDEDFSSLAP